MLIAVPNEKFLDSWGVPGRQHGLTCYIRHVEPGQSRPDSGMGGHGRAEPDHGMWGRA